MAYLVLLNFVLLYFTNTVGFFVGGHGGFCFFFFFFFLQIEDL